MASAGRPHRATRVSPGRLAWARSTPPGWRRERRAAWWGGRRRRGWGRRARGRGGVKTTAGRGGGSSAAARSRSVDGVGARVRVSTTLRVDGLDERGDDTAQEARHRGSGPAWADAVAAKASPRNGSADGGRTVTITLRPRSVDRRAPAGVAGERVARGLARVAVLDQRHRTGLGSGRGVARRRPRGEHGHDRDAGDERERQQRDELDRSLAPLGAHDTTDGTERGHSCGRKRAVAEVWPRTCRPRTGGMRTVTVTVPRSGSLTRRSRRSPAESARRAARSASSPIAAARAPARAAPPAAQAACAGHDELPRAGEQERGERQDRDELDRRLPVFADGWRHGPEARGAGRAALVATVTNVCRNRDEWHVGRIDRAWRGQDDPGRRGARGAAAAQRGAARPPIRRCGARR